MPLPASTCVFVFVGRKPPTDNDHSWELVFTAGFELDVLRRKRPYRWTIWVNSLLHIGPYHRLNESSYNLGTRYTGLLGFICLLVGLDGPRVPCQVSLW